MATYGERIIVQKPGWAPIILRWCFLDNCWVYLRDIDQYKEEHWSNIPSHVDVEGAIRDYRVDKPMPYRSAFAPPEKPVQLEIKFPDLPDKA